MCLYRKGTKTRISMSSRSLQHGASHYLAKLPEVEGDGTLPSLTFIFQKDGFKGPR